jgi:hypothetical protein
MSKAKTELDAFLERVRWAAAQSKVPVVWFVSAPTGTEGDPGRMSTYGGGGGGTIDLQTYLFLSALLIADATTAFFDRAKGAGMTEEQATETMAKFLHEAFSSRRPLGGAQ